MQYTTAKPHVRCQALTTVQASGPKQYTDQGVFLEVKGQGLCQLVNGRLAVQCAGGCGHRVFAAKVGG